VEVESIGLVPLVTADRVQIEQFSINFERHGNSAAERSDARVCVTIRICATSNHAPGEDNGRGGIDPWTTFLTPTDHQATRDGPWLAFELDESFRGTRAASGGSRSPGRDL
jgi:hypothetical protein